MIIHSVVAPELLYEGPELPKLYTMPFSAGLIEGYDSGKDFIVNRIISTDPSVFLQDALTPGRVYQPK